jgi:hypothetical protein
MSFFWMDWTFTLWHKIKICNVDFISSCWIKTVSGCFIKKGCKNEERTLLPLLCKQINKSIARLSVCDASKFRGLLLYIWACICNSIGIQLPCFVLQPDSLKISHCFPSNQKSKCNNYSCCWKGWKKIIRSTAYTLFNNYLAGCS